MIADISIFQPVLADIGLSLLQLLLFFVSLWLIFLILIQRGKGGGLTAAFGGGGGDSAFGAKAGDAFTKITVVSALVWITLCMVTIARYNPPEQPVNPYAQADQELPEDQGPSLGSGVPISSTDEASGGGADTSGEAASGESTADSSSTDDESSDEGSGANEGDPSEGSGQ
jgi:preprotein translocase subunit SecG